VVYALVFFAFILTNKIFAKSKIRTKIISSYFLGLIIIFHISEIGTPKIAWHLHLIGLIIGFLFHFIKKRIIHNNHFITHSFSRLFF
jgi:membrane-associated PAP2 superfamily phosphatase